MARYPNNYYMPQPETKVGSMGCSLLLESNMSRLDLDDRDSRVFVYAVYFDSDESLSDRKLSVQSVEVDSTFAYDGTFLYVAEKMKKYVTKFRIPHPTKLGKVVVFKIMFRSKSKLGKCQGLLKYLMVNLPTFLGCKPHNRVFYNPNVCRKVPNSDIEVYGAYRVRVAQAEISPAIVIDVLHCLQRGRTIAEIFSSCKEKFKGDDSALKNYCLGKFAADNYRNMVVKIGDVYFEKGSSQPVLKAWIKSHPDEKQRKRNCWTVSSSSYSLLVNRNGLVPTPSEKSGITKFTRVSANVRVQCILRFLASICGNVECTRTLRNWKISLTPTLIPLNARVLLPPNVTFGNGICMQNRRLFWNPKENIPTALFDPAELGKWSLFCFESDAQLAQKLEASLYFESKRFGVKICRGTLEIVKRKKKSRLPVLFTEKMLRKIKSDVEFVVIVLPHASGASEANELYNQLKKLCLINFGIISQMIKVETIRSRAKDRKTWNAFIGGVMSGIACKKGSSLWRVHVPLKEKVMFVGMDVWHGSSKETNSVGALIFSLNTNMLKTYSAAILHEWRQELFNSIRDHFVLALEAFVEENKQLPDRIMIYRDGVLRRNYKTILSHELQQFLDVIEMLYRRSHPLVSFIVVQKRVYERFFVKLETGKYINSPPGTVVDHGLTRSKCYDFFLNSMHRIKGTTIPTHYVMIYDNSGMLPDTFHEVTNSLCFSYFNWPGTFYVPGVVQYAHKLASYAGRIGVIPPASLSKQLHFL